MICIGIDYSLSSPAVCVFQAVDKEFSYDKCSFHFLTSSKKMEVNFPNIKGTRHLEYTSEEERYDNISNWVMNIVHSNKPDTVLIEGYSMGSTGRVFNIGENCGLLKHKLFKSDYKYQVMPPTQIKKLATGKGNANKELMQTAFVEETGVDIKKLLNMTDKAWNPSSDIIDAYYITKIAHQLQTVSC